LICQEQHHKKKILQLVQKLNNDKEVNGILVQLPLPSHIDSEAIIEAVDPLKDVDGLHSVNNGDLFRNGMDAGLIPCTPLGCMRLLEHYHVPLEGKKVVIIGRSHLVGKPVAMLALSKNATVTICHSRTKNLNQVVKEGEILIAAIGKPNFVKGDWIQPGATVIDVGINAIEDKSKKAGHRLVGDVDFESAKRVAGGITPVPGGIGLMTVAMLLSNTVKAWTLQNHNPI